MSNDPIPVDEVTPLELADIKGDEFTEVDTYDPKVKAKAYSLYLNTGMSITDIALETGVRGKVIASWARKGKWRDRKMEIEKEMFDRAADGYRALIIQHRAPTVERHLRVSQKLEEGIEKVIEHETSDPDGVPNGMQLKRMAEALSAATGVSARAAAITDRAFDSVDQGTGNQERVPLVVINTVPTVSNGKADPKVVEVEVTEPGKS